MTKQTEAMKLALEALVKALPDMPVHTDWHFEAITALREALAEQPAQRTWVGLSYEDIDIAFDDTQEGGGFDDFARAIEAKLKEKNT